MNNYLVYSLGLISLIITSNVFADKELEANEIFRMGQQSYDAGEFIEAMPDLQRAVELEPLNSEYQHMLGKCYGRIAEHGSWFTALRYVKRTLHQFEKAVELDPENYPAWRDLEEFYRRAPSFLGGNKKRALEIRKMLDKDDQSALDLPALLPGKRDTL